MIDKQTFVALVDEKSQTLFRVARSILRSEEDCNDALQEGILKAWAARHKLKNEGYFATWITRIVINECHNIQRKQAKYALMAEVGVEAACPAPDVDLHKAVDALPEALRLPVILHYVEGYSGKEIASMLRIPLVTVRNRLYSARKKLRLELEPEEAQPDEA